MEKESARVMVWRQMPLSSAEGGMSRYFSQRFCSGKPTRLWIHFGKATVMTFGVALGVETHFFR